MSNKTTDLATIAEMPNDVLGLRLFIIGAMAVDYRQKGDEKSLAWAEKEIDAMVPICNERFPEPEGNRQ